MTITITQEKYDEIIQEAMPLIQRHYNEIAWNKEKIPLDIDHDFYKMLENNGCLFIYCARQDGVLVGYSAWVVQPRNLHYKSLKAAKNDVIFVEKSKRGSIIGKMLLNHAEKELKSKGVNMLMLHIKEKMNWGRLAEHLGYEHTEASWWKWTGEQDGN
jgi:GNAT superfamily N-acetyltransferase